MLYCQSVASTVSDPHPELVVQLSQETYQKDLLLQPVTFMHQLTHRAVIFHQLGCIAAPTKCIQNGEGSDGSNYDFRFYLQTPLSIAHTVNAYTTIIMTLRSWTD